MKGYPSDTYVDQWVDRIAAELQSMGLRVDPTGPISAPATAAEVYAGDDGRMVSVAYWGSVAVCGTRRLMFTISLYEREPQGKWARRRSVHDVRHTLVVSAVVDLLASGQQPS